MYTCGGLQKFARAAITKYNTLGGLKTNLLTHGSGHWKSKIKVLAGLAPSKSCEGGICPKSLSWLIDDHRLPVSIHTSSLYTCFCV